MLKSGFLLDVVAFVLIVGFLTVLGPLVIRVPVMRYRRARATTSRWTSQPLTVMA